MRLHAPPNPPACPHRPPCSACPRFGERTLAPQALAALNGLASRHGLPPVEVVSSRLAGFRMRARLAIRGRVGSPKIGLFEEGTHRVVHIPNCSVQHPLINRVASVVRRALVETRISCYSEGAKVGLARYLQVVIERRSQTAQVVLIANAAHAEPLRACLDLIRERLGTELHSLWFNSNTGQSNSILGHDFEQWSGPAGVVEHFGGAAVHYPPGAFGQSNLDVAEAIIARIRADIPADARITEYYAGVGAIGLSLLGRVASLTLNEVSPHSLHGLELGIADLDAEQRQKITVVPGTAADAAWAADAAPQPAAHIVIADPPRKGLDASLTEHLRRRAPARFLYVSCGLESFIADCGRLTEGGTLRLRGLTAFNLLPFTEHVETLARFERA